MTETLSYKYNSHSNLEKKQGKENLLLSKFNEVESISNKKEKLKA